MDDTGRDLVLWDKEEIPNSSHAIALAQVCDRIGGKGRRVDSEDIVPGLDEDSVGVIGRNVEQVSSVAAGCGDNTVQSKIVSKTEWHALGCGETDCDKVINSCAGKRV